MSTSGRDVPAYTRDVPLPAPVDYSESIKCLRDCKMTPKPLLLRTVLSDSKSPKVENFYLGEASSTRSCTSFSLLESTVCDGRHFTPQVPTTYGTPTQGGRGHRGLVDTGDSWTQGTR